MSSKQLTDISPSEIATVAPTDLIDHLKLSRQMPSLLTSIVNQKIIARTARRENITLSEVELQTAADRFRYEHQLVSSKATLHWFQKYHLSVTEFERLIHNRLLKQKLAQHLFAEQVEPYFYSNQLDYYQTVFYEIVLDNFDLGMELYYGIQEQELSFWNLAREYIDDLELRRRGGYQGKKMRSQLPAEVAAAVFSPKTEQTPIVLKPIAINKKTHLIYVEEVIQPNLDESLRQTILDRLFENWLNKQRQQLTENVRIAN